MDQVQLFETFARVTSVGSLSGAARELGCSLSAVSRRLDELEANLGVQLLDRSSRALRVTSAGERLLPHVSSVLRAVEAARHAATGAETEDALVRLSVPAPIGMTRVMPALARLAAMEPKLRVEVLINNEMISLDKTDVDIIVRAGVSRLPSSNDLIARSIGRYQYVFCASPGFLAQHRGPVRPEELSAMRIVAHVATRGRRIYLRRGTEKVEITLNAHLWTNDMLALRSAVRDGLGIGALPQWLVNEDIAKKALRPVLADWVTPSAEEWVAYRRRGRNQPAVRLVVAHLTTALRAAG